MVTEKLCWFPSLLLLLPLLSNTAEMRTGTAFSPQCFVSSAPSSSYSSLDPLWCYSHGIQYFTTCSNAGPSDGVQFFRNCTGPSHGLQSYQELTAPVQFLNMLQVAVPARKPAPVWALLHELQSCPVACYCNDSLQSATSFRSYPAVWGPSWTAVWISSSMWSSMGLQGEACFTMGPITGCKGTSAPIP